MRRAAALIEGWIDDAGLLWSHSYDLDQVWREIDGVAQASACLAFRKLAALEGVMAEDAGKNRAESVASRLARAVETHFWDPALGYHVEHLVYNDAADSRRLGSVRGVSSELDSAHAAAKAIDGVMYRSDRVEGWITGPAGPRRLCLPCRRRSRPGPALSARPGSRSRPRRRGHLSHSL